MINKDEKLKNWLYSNKPLEITNNVKDIIKNELPKLSEIYIDAVVIILHRMSNIPWYTQKELMQETKLNRNELLELNKHIRNSEYLQDIIVNHGLGRKYWQTIIPLVNTGAVQNCIDQVYNFPIRIGIYPGLSCMFYCGFCGRNQKAVYRRDVKEEGYERFKDIFDSMPKFSTISISGGLEPLTHPRIGDIISYAKSRNIRVPLITNAYMLTKRYVEKQPGLLDLDSLRVSLYGIDEDSSYYVSRKRGAYKLVKNNIIEFLKTRNEKNPNLKLGLNYIIIPENVNHISKLIDYIIEVNSQVTNGRGIDYITIREDFGSMTDTTGDATERTHELNGFLSKSDRTNLINEFLEFNKKKEKYCPELNVDFGYAMITLAEGVLGSQIKMVDGLDMRKSAYPQISIAVDNYGDVFLYREAGFLDRTGNEKFIIGRISNDNSFEDIVKKFVEDKTESILDKNDNRFMDAFDHLVTVILNQAQDDLNIEIPFEQGPVMARTNVHNNDLNSDIKKKGLFGTYHQ
jgi:dTDP-4-amino-4,6-dideoxy-D-glucose ammonia-lyase